MEEKNKIEETEEVKEINPIDEYLDNYKEQKLAEFCVQKDKEIEGRKKEKHDLLLQLAEMKRKVEKYDKTWKSIESLYSEIKRLSVDDYLKLYYLFTKDVSGYNSGYNKATYTTTLSSSNLENIFSN